MKGEIGTRDLFLETLTKMGCQYEIDDDNQIRFMWQGGHFAADANNDCAFVVVKSGGTVLPIISYKEAQGV